MGDTTGGKGSAHDAEIEAGVRPAATPAEGARFDAAVAHRTVERLRDKVAKLEDHVKGAKAALVEAERDAKAADKVHAGAMRAAKSEGADS